MLKHFWVIFSQSRPRCKILLIFLKTFLSDSSMEAVSARRPFMCYPLSLLTTAGSGGDLCWSPGNVLWEEVKHLTYPAPKDNRLQHSFDKATVFRASSAPCWWWNYYLSPDLTVRWHSILLLLSHCEGRCRIQQIHSHHSSSLRKLIADKTYFLMKTKYSRKRNRK